MAEVAWLVHSRQEETEGGPHRNLQLLPGTMIVSETVAQCVFQGAQISPQSKETLDSFPFSSTNESRTFYGLIEDCP